MLARGTITEWACALSGKPHGPSLNPTCLCKSVGGVGLKSKSYKYLLLIFQIFRW